MIANNAGLRALSSGWPSFWLPAATRRPLPSGQLSSYNLVWQRPFGRQPLVCLLETKNAKNRTKCCSATLCPAVLQEPAPRHFYHPAMPLMSWLHSMPIVPRYSTPSFNRAPTLRPSLCSASLWRFIVLHSTKFLLCH